MPVLDLSYKLRPNTYSCGPTALHNALLACGERHSIKKLCKLAKVSKAHGANEVKLINAVWWVGYALDEVRCRSAEFAKAVVESHGPLLTCVDRDKEGLYSHWITVVHHTKRHVWIADSSKPAPVLQRLTWRQFLARAVAVHGPNDSSYNFYILRKKK